MCVVVKKLDLIEYLAKYDSKEKGWGRKNLYGDNEQVKNLRGILALPHIKALQNDAEISVPIELHRLEISYESIYNCEFLINSFGHASSILSYSSSAIVPVELDPSIFAYTSPTAIMPISKKIENALLVIRDKLIFYIACVSSQPQFILFAAEYFASGGSGYSGLLRAKKLLLVVESALAKYKDSGLLSPLILESSSLNLGAHTLNLIKPTIATMMDDIMYHFEIEIKFVNEVYTTKVFDESVKAKRTHCQLKIAGREIINEFFECYCSDDMFLGFLEKYLIKKEFSFNDRSPSRFSTDDFKAEFENYLLESQDYEQYAIISGANAAAHCN